MLTELFGEMSESARADLERAMEWVQVDGGPPVAGVTITVLAGIIPVAEAVTGPDGRFSRDQPPVAH